MNRRSFEYLYNEICVAVNQRISHYNLWLLVWDAGGDPEELTRPQARCFLDNSLSALLREEGLSLSGRARRRLETRILRFDPQHRTPEEWLDGRFSRGEEAA
jgi:hypothetical protein